MTPEEEAVIEAARRWAYATEVDDTEDADDALQDAVVALERARRPVEPKAFDPDNPGCAPGTCGGSRLDPCSAVLRTEGAVHDDDTRADPVERFWAEVAPEDLVQGGDGKYYRVTRIAEGGGPNVGRIMVSMQIGMEPEPRTYPMFSDRQVLVKRGAAGLAVDALRGAGLGPEVIRS